MYRAALPDAIGGPGWHRSPFRRASIEERSSDGLLSASLPSASTGLAGLRASAHALTELADESSVFLRAVFVLNLEAATSIPELQPRMAVWLGEVERNFRAHVADGIADGSIRPTVRPETKATELLALTIGSAYLFLLDGDQTDPSRLLQGALDDIEADH
jgi:hypothetical protein